MNMRQKYFWQGSRAVLIECSGGRVRWGHPDDRGGTAWIPWLCRDDLIGSSGALAQEALSFLGESAPDPGHRSRRRDLFTAAALAGILSGPEDKKNAVRDAVAYANALIGEMGDEDEGY